MTIANMDDLSGRTLRGYELKHCLGKGGFGAVYLASQPTVGREVAIKVILPQFANQPEFIRRFESEARLVARLEHPHIVPLYDFWRDPEGAYLVMRYLRGGSLRDLLRGRPVEPERVLQLATQLAGALDLAHRHGVVHRDIKPDNILLDEDGNAYLTDFGIAKAIQGGGERPNLPDEQDGMTAGSFGYLSPEQALGQTVDARSDLYSLSVMLYELLAGQHPFSGVPPAMQLLKHISDPFPSLNQACPELAPALDAVMQRASSKAPDERYTSVVEYVDALHSALTATPVSLHDVEPLMIYNPYKGLRPFEEFGSLPRWCFLRYDRRKYHPRERTWRNLRKPKISVQTQLVQIMGSCRAISRNRTLKS